MATPSVKKGTATAVLAAALCEQCGVKGHLMSDHIEEKGRQCTKCACVAQDVHGDPRAR